MSPPYVAVMLLLPIASAVVLQLALMPETAAVHKVLVPFVKVTVPVGLTALLSVAVSVTVAPKALGLGLLVTASVGVGANASGANGSEMAPRVVLLSPMPLSVTV